MSHPPDHIPELDSPRQSRSPLKKDKKEQVSDGENRILTTDDRAKNKIKIKNMLENFAKKAK